MENTILEYLPAEAELRVQALLGALPLCGLGAAAVHGLDVEQRGLLRVEVVAEAADPAQVRHAVERHVAQRQQLARVVVAPAQPEAVTGQVEVSDGVGEAPTTPVSLKEIQERKFLPCCSYFAT